MHIKTGQWDSSSVCDSVLCDPVVLEPQIRNRRLSPGSGSSGGGGGGGPAHFHTPGHTHSPQQQHPERERQRTTKTIVEASSTESVSIKSNHQAPPPLRKSRHSRSSRRERKQRWAEQSGLSLLRAPPTFPVQDSPAKLQPAVSYASKVKGGLEVLLQNQWGLSFISETPRPVPESPAPSPALPLSPPPPEAPPLGPPEATPFALPRPLQEEQENNSKLLLSCRHLLDALSYHKQEWEALFSRHNKEPRSVLWLEENPA